MATTSTTQNTRQRILAAAEEVFAERGYEGAALADIARRAGFTTGAIYGCFRDKAELLLEVVRSVLESQQEAAVAYSRLDAGDGELPARVAGLADQFVDDAGARQRALVLEAHVAAELLGQADELGEEAPEGLPLDELHHEVGGLPPLRLVGRRVERPDDVLVPHLPADLRLAQEALQEPGARDQVVVDQLDRDGLAGS